MDKVLIESVAQAGVTKLVAPAYADILVKTGRYRRSVVPRQTRVVPAAVAPTTAQQPVAHRTPTGQYRRRDLKAEGS